MEHLFEKGTNDGVMSISIFISFNLARNKRLKIVWYSDADYEKKVQSSLRIADALHAILAKNDYEIPYRSLGLLYDHIEG